MGKMHRIVDSRFKMDENGELVCRLGMSIDCRVKTGWGQEGDPVEFYYRNQKLNGPETRVGDIIYMDHDGPRTSWLIAKKPRDPRLLLLWEFGYRSSTRVKVEDPSPATVIRALRTKAFGFDYTDGLGHTNWAWNEYGAFIGDGFKKPNLIKDNDGEVKVALYSGKVYVGDSTFCQWYMRDDATLADVRAALLADSSLNKTHPLLQ